MRGWNDMLGLNVFHIVKEHHEVSYDVVSVAQTAIGPSVVKMSFTDKMR